MRVCIEKESLIKATQELQNIVSVKNTLPILSNILIETEDNKIKLTATDLEVGMQYIIPAEVFQQGSITVPAKKFYDIIKELPNAPISLNALKNNTINIINEGVYFKLLGLPKDDFPKTPQLSIDINLEMDQAALKNMLAMTMFASSHDEVRYILNGILFFVKNQILRLVATDGRRLAMIERSAQAPKDWTKQVIVPNKAAQQLIRILKEEGQIKMAFGENQLIFKLDNIILITRLIEGEFPNYEQVVPEEMPNKIKVSSQRFLTGAKRAALMTNMDSQSIRLDLLKDKMVISKNTAEMGEAKDHIDVAYSGKEMSIGFNPYYLMDVLKNINQEEIELEVEAPDKAGVVRSSAGGRYVYLVLPMQLG